MLSHLLLIRATNKRILASSIKNQITLKKNIDQTFIATKGLTTIITTIIRAIIIIIILIRNTITIIRARINLIIVKK